MYNPNTATVIPYSNVEMNQVLEGTDNAVEVTPTMATEDWLKMQQDAHAEASKLLSADY